MVGLRSPQVVRFRVVLSEVEGITTKNSIEVNREVIFV